MCRVVDKQATNASAWSALLGREIWLQAVAHLVALWTAVLGGFLLAKASGVSVDTSSALGGLQDLGSICGTVRRRTNDGQEYPASQSKLDHG